MEERGNFFVSLDREWVATHTGLPIECRYSNRSNCRRAIYDEKRNLTTRLCREIRLADARARKEKIKTEVLLQNVRTVIRVHSDTDECHEPPGGDARRNEKSNREADFRFDCANQSYRVSHINLSNTRSSTKA
jgi:hypothetical protein